MALDHICIGRRIQEKKGEKGGALWQTNMAMEAADFHKSMDSHGSSKLREAVTVFSMHV